MPASSPVPVVGVPLEQAPQKLALGPFRGCEDKRGYLLVIGAAAALVPEELGDMAIANVQPILEPVAS